MAAVAVLEQEIITVGAVNFSFSRFIYNVSGDTVPTPLGGQAVAVIPVIDGTAPSAAITQGAGTVDSVALTGGTTGKQYWVVVRHSGVITR